MSNPKISIISPVYNVEKYIHRCVDSIIAQTFTDWELILVDDGSPDASGLICDQYAKQDSRIRVIHKQNGGVSAARQTGLDAVLGEYVIHADPDDWVEPTMLEELYAKAKAEDADIVICDYFTNGKNGQKLVVQKPSATTANAFLHDLFHYIHGSLWNKLVRRGCFSSIDIRFYKGVNYCEDFLWWAQLLQQNNLTVDYLPQAYYHYWENPESISRNYTRKTYQVQLDFFDKLKQVVTDSQFEHDMREMAYGIFVDGFVHNVLTDIEIREVSRNLKDIGLRSGGIRWRLGFFMMQIGRISAARKLIKY